MAFVCAALSVVTISNSQFCSVLGGLILSTKSVLTSATSALFNTNSSSVSKMISALLMSFPSLKPVCALSNWGDGSCLANSKTKCALSGIAARSLKQRISR